MTLTVFTPAYNRAYTLPKLYESLINQTCKDFCWLIVDDGSTDNTEELIKGYISENLIKISYYKQQNAGKHIAHNKGIELCETELFICVDSDDWLSSNAIEMIISKLKSENNVLGAYFRRVYPDGKNIATAYPQKIKYIGIEDLYHKYSFSGDTAIVLKTKLIKSIKFPSFSGEKFLTERIWYNMLNDIAPMLLCEEGIYYCEYLPDGLSKNIEKIMDNNPYGTALDLLSESYYGIRFIYRLKNSINYYRFVKNHHLDTSKFKEYKLPLFISLLGRFLSLELIYNCLKNVKQLIKNV